MIGKTIKYISSIVFICLACILPADELSATSPVRRDTAIFTLQLTPPSLSPLLSCYRSMSEPIDTLDLESIGPKFENDPLFPERVNTEFIKVLNRTTLKMRVWERGSGETFACGSGACAAVVAAVENGFCPKDTDITVKLIGGDLKIRYTDDAVYLTGDAVKVYEGKVVL